MSHPRARVLKGIERLIFRLAWGSLEHRACDEPPFLAWEQNNKQATMGHFWVLLVTEYMGLIYPRDFHNVSLLVSFQDAVRHNVPLRLCCLFTLQLLSKLLFGMQTDNRNRKANLVQSGGVLLESGGAANKSRLPSSGPKKSSGQRVCVKERERERETAQFPLLLSSPHIET